MGKRTESRRIRQHWIKKIRLQIIHQVIPQKIRGTKKMRIRTAKIPEVKTVEMWLMTGKIPAMKLVRIPVTKRTIPENLVVRTSEMKILPLKIPIKKTRISPKTIPRIIFPNVRKTSRKVKLTKPKVTGTYLSVRSFRIRTEMI